MEHVDGRPTESRDATQLLTRNAELGEYFSLPPAAGTNWMRFPDLLSHETLSSFVNLTRIAIAQYSRCRPDEISPRLAASSFQLGIAARLLSPLLGAMICDNALPGIRPDNLFWCSAGHYPTFGARGAMSLEVGTDQQLAQLLSDRIITPIIAPLNSALRTVAALPPKVAWGNVASAANGAVTVMSMSRPHLEQAGRSVVQALTETQILTGTAVFRSGKFLRQNCCLFYQAPRSGLCGDCVLARSETSL